MPEDDKDALEALDALESEAKEWEKDAEIERILNAFRLDAYAPLALPFHYLTSPPYLPTPPSLPSSPSAPQPNNPAATPF